MFVERISVVRLSLYRGPPGYCRGAADLNGN